MKCNFLKRLSLFSICVFLCLSSSSQSKILKNTHVANVENDKLICDSTSKQGLKFFIKKDYDIFEAKKNTKVKELDRVMDFGLLEGNTRDSLISLCRCAVTQVARPAEIQKLCTSRYSMVIKLYVGKGGVVIYDELEFKRDYSSILSDVQKFQILKLLLKSTVNNERTSRIKDYTIINYSINALFKKKTSNAYCH